MFVISDTFCNINNLFISTAKFIYIFDYDFSAQTAIIPQTTYFIGFYNVDRGILCYFGIEFLYIFCWKLVSKVLYFTASKLFYCLSIAWDVVYEVSDGNTLLFETLNKRGKSSTGRISSNSSHCTFKMIKSRIIRWTGHVLCWIK
jgi:hypothetical protein